MIYIYQHPETDEIKEICQGMNDVHEYFEDGIKWNRVFTVPTMSMNAKIDAFSSEDVVRKTANHKGTLGDLFDMSRDMAEKRKDRAGHDPVQEKAVKNYKKKTNLKHLSEVKRD